MFTHDEEDMTFVNKIVGMQTYHDKTICHAHITGGGNRFYGFKTFKFGRASKTLAKHQKNVVFRHTSDGVVEIEARSMTDRHTCTGVVDPMQLPHTPHNLTALGDPIHAGAVSKHTFAWTPTITDTLLHKISHHPYVLDVWIEAGKLIVFIVHDRNIRGGLMDQVVQGKHRQACNTGTGSLRRRLATKSAVSHSSSAWRPRSRQMKTKQRRGSQHSH